MLCGRILGESEGGGGFVVVWREGVWGDAVGIGFGVGVVIL